MTSGASANRIAVKAKENRNNNAYLKVFSSPAAAVLIAALFFRKAFIATPSQVGYGSHNEQDDQAIFHRVLRLFFPG